MGAKIERKSPGLIERKSFGLNRPDKSRISRQSDTEPDFDSIFDDGIGTPLPVPEPGDIQASADAEMSEIERQIRANREKSEERFRIGTDTEYFFLVCFQTREQKEQFLERVGWSKLGNKYINGLELAELLGASVDIIEMEPRPLRGKKSNFSRKEVLSHAR